MQYWLLKSEPDAFGIDDLIAMKDQRDHWDGIRNYQARNLMRDQMKAGDEAFFYHSSCKVPGIVGIVEIVREAYPDHTAQDPDSKYYDPRATAKDPRWVMVDVQFKQKFEQIITLRALRDNPDLAEMALLRKGSRLSIQPVTGKQWRAINKMRTSD